MTGYRAAAAVVALGAALAFPEVAAGQRCPDCFRAGAATIALEPPAGTPLAGYGGPARRLLFPDVLGRHPHAFWFRPSEGERDALTARALVVEQDGTRITWITVDLVAVDHALTGAVAQGLREAALGPGTLVISASHTHSGPGAFGTSTFWAVVAADRHDADVRARLVQQMVEAVRRAAAAMVPARMASFSANAGGLTEGRLDEPVDREVVGIKFVSERGAPLALVWNYAIHGTTLGARNLRFSGDVMGIAARALEHELRVPALFVNGAVGDVRPARHGEAAATALAERLTEVVRAAWARAPRPRGGRVAARTARVALPLPSLSLRNCVSGWLPRAFALPLPGLGGGDTELTAVALGDVAAVTIPGELQSRLGQTVKRAARPHFARAFVAGVSNDYLGYFVSADAYDRPAYVTCASLYGSSGGDRLAQAAATLVRALADGDLTAPARPARPGGRAQP